ncbi:MAG TPA: response regulator transcription factor [Candidatus Acidoferrales bacterium]
MSKALESQTNVVNVIIAEASEMYCQLVQSAFRPRRYRVGVLATAVKSVHAIKLLKERQPDVAIISAQLHDGPLAGFGVLRELRALQSRTRAVMLLSSRERNLVVDAFRSGAHGVIFRDEPLETLSKCVHAVHEGQVWANSEHLGYLLEALAHVKPLRLQDARGANILTEREEKVVHLVAEGLTNKQISAELELSEHTVKNYLFKIFDKLGVSTRVELVLYCLQEKPSPQQLAF